MKTLKPFGSANPHTESVRPSTDGHCDRIRRKTAIGPARERTPNPRSGLLRTSLHLLAIGFLFSLLHTYVAAAVFVVTNTADTIPASPGSLRQALTNAAGNAGADTINFDPAVFTTASHTITVVGELVVSDAGGVTVDATSLPYGVTITGGSAVRLINVAVGGNLTLRGLTLTGGSGTGATFSGSGGALYNSGTVAVERCTLSGNSATTGGAIRNDGTLTLIQSTLSGNSSPNDGGAIVNFGSSLTLTHCTISGNTATNLGGGIMVSSGSATITNSIVSGNSGANGRDIWSNGPAGGVTRGGANIIGFAGKTPDAPDSGPVANTADPLLGPLTDNGGPTQTMALLAYSKAIDGVPATAVVTGIDIDQRGFARSLGSGPDLGAYESGDAVFTSDGLSLYTRVPAEQVGSGVFFEISANADFSVPLPIVSTFAGVPNDDGFIDGESRLSAKFNYPFGVAQDSLGNIFIADTGNNVIRMISPDAKVTTIAGSGIYGRANGPGLSAAFAFPSAVAVGPDDNVYVSDTYNHRICKLTRPATVGAQWTVTNLAGTGTAGFLNGAGSVARFKYPYGLDLDAFGNVYVADALNHRIRKVTPAGVVSTFAGSGEAGFSPDNALLADAKFDTPQGVVIVAKAGFQETACVADRGNNRIRLITTTTDASGLVASAVTTLAGSGVAGFADGTGTGAQFQSPSGLAADSDRNLYIADEENDRIRKVTPAGDVTTVAGTGTPGFLNGVSTVSRFSAPTALLVARDGTLVVADSENHVLRTIAIGPLRVPAIADPGNVNAVGMQLSAVLDLDLLGLNPDVRYYFRYRLPDDTTQTLGQSFTFVELPTVVTVAADSLTPTAGRLKATVDPNNLPTNAVLQYSTEPTLEAPLAVTTVAGSGVAGFLDSVTPSLAQFNSPGGLAVSGGKVYVADFLNHRIRKISATGAVTTFAGSSASGFVNGTGAAAQFDRPAGIAAEPDVVLANCSTVFGSATVACDSTAALVQGVSVNGTNIPAGATVLSIADATHFVLSAAATGTSNGLTLTAGGANFYVADQFNHCVRKISASGQVTILAGSGIAGFADGPAGQAKFLFPKGVALDSAVPPNIYVADSGNHSIRKVSPDGTVTTFAGSGVSGFADGPAGTAQFASPGGVAVNSAGDVFVADTNNHLIRVIAGGNVSTYAGSTQGFLDGPGASAMFNSPSGIVLTADGTAYVADSANHRVRRIDVGGVVSTHAGSGVPGAINSPATGLYPVSATQFNFPVGIAVDGAGGVLVTQEGLVRKIARGALQTLAWPLTLTGTAPLPIARDVSGLLPGTTYYFRAKGTCLQATIFGAILSLSTPAAPITVAAGLSIASPEVLNGQTNAVDFGETPLGTPIARQFTISNPNGTPFTVTAINVPTGYQLTGGTGVNLVLPGGTLIFEVTLLANTTGGTKSGNIFISSDAPGLGTFSFPITGVVLAPPAVTTLAATANGSGNATLNATVNPLGSATDVWFQWSLTGQFDGLLVSTLAGSSPGDAEGIGTAAKFNQPYSLASDAGGNIFVADTKNHRIRRIAPDGTVSTFVGTGTPGFADGPGATAQFNEPTGLVFNGAGTLFVSDSQNHRIRAITPAGEVRTYSGTGEAGFTDGVAIAARFSTPWGIAIDAEGVLYVADRNNHRIRKVAVNGGASTLAGTGVPGTTNGAGNIAQFDQPLGIALDAAGSVYVTETTSHAIRKLTPDGTTSIFAGSPTTPDFVNGAAAAARFFNPVGLAVDGGGSIFVADKGNHSIRKLASMVGGGGVVSVTVTTFAGLGVPGAFDGLKNVARFDSPISVLAMPDRGAVVGELTQSTIRKITPTEPLLPAASGLTGTAGVPVQLQVTGLTIGSTYYYRAVATNVRGTNFGSPISVVAGTPFELWQLANFGAEANNPIIGGDAATPANDGISNRLKYALGLDPLTDSVESLPAVKVTDGVLSLTYTKVLAATDILYTAQWSSDLITWQTVGITEQALPPSGGKQQVVASIPIAPHRIKFLRLNVTFLSP
jgi:sugar lactone lactonase YvrE